MKSIFAAAMSAALLSACASSPPPAPAAPTAAKTAPVQTAKADADPNERICRREVLTGHTLPTSVCHTRAEWTAMAQANQRGVNDFDDARRSQTLHDN